MSRQRGSTWQADFIASNGRRYRPGGFKSKAEANLWEAQARVDDERGLFSPPPIHRQHGHRSATAADLTLGELRKRVLACAAPDGWKGSKAMRTSCMNSGQVVRFFGAETTISLIDVNGVDRFATALARNHNSAATINRKLATLSKMLGYAKKRGLLTTLPHIARQKENEGRLRFLTWEEETAVLAAFAAAGEHVLQQLTIFLLDTGCRVSEALRLAPGDVTTGPGATATFWETKGGKPRTIPLTLRAAATCAGSEDRRGPFAAIKYWTYRAAWDRKRRQLGPGFDDVVIHTWRHTCCSRLVQAGIDLHRVMKWMGHRNLQTTLRYAHLAPGDLDGMADKLGRPN